MDWSEIEQAAHGTTVRAGMWTGDPLINAYMRGAVAPWLETRYDVRLEVIPVQGPAIVNRLAAGLDAGRQRGDLDLVWINGETFYQLQGISALYGPFAQDLPNARYVDWESPFIGKDFQQPVEGMEVPWGTVQFTLIYSSGRVANVPQTVEALADWIRSHPGRFTLSADFTGIGFLKALLYHFAEDPSALDGPFDVNAYRAAATRLWDYLRPLRPYFWRGGETYPQNVTRLHQLFANQEIDFTMSYNDGEVDNKVMQGILPDDSRAYVPEFGSLRNSHYWGIPVNAPNKAGALVAINLMLSPEAQFEKAKPSVWGDGTVLAVEELPEPWPSRFRKTPGRERVPSRESIRPRALPEPASEVTIWLTRDFRKQMIEPAP